MAVAGSERLQTTAMVRWLYFTLMKSCLLQALVPWQVIGVFRVLCFSKASLRRDVNRGIFQRWKDVMPSYHTYISDIVYVRLLSGSRHYQLDND
jgi:hypothetical protein